MINDKLVYALIPARGGSKAIPEKSIVSLNNKPLISYTIEQAFESSYIDRVIVSTDSEKIASISREYQAEVPFMRPAEYATDTASSASVIKHALEYFRDVENKMPEILVFLQPTSPLRLSEDIDNSLALFESQPEHCLKSVCKSPVSPYWLKTILDSNYLLDFIKPSSSYVRRQDTDDIYLLNGAIYIYCSESFLSHTIEENKDELAYIMPKERSVDIDELIDLEFAEFLLKRNQS